MQIFHYILVFCSLCGLVNDPWDQVDLQLQHLSLSFVVSDL